MTDRRVLILTPGGPAQSLSPAQASARQVRADQRGYGDLYFAPLDKLIESSDGGHTERNGFLGIPDVKAVDALIGRTFGEDPLPR